MSVGKPIMVEVSDSFSRPADTTNYADNDLVANDVDAGDVDPLAFSVPIGNGRGLKVVGARLQKSGTGVTGATFELHLFKSEPTVTVGDNTAFSFANVDASGYIGTIVFPAMAAFSDDAKAVVHVGDQTGGINPIYCTIAATDTLYGLLHCAAAYTDEASAETFTVTLTLEQY